jgi:TatD DNase family protein
MGLIDTHTHLESFARNGTLPDVLARAREAGLDAMITVGTSPEDWALYRNLAQEHAGFVHYTVGLHPCSVDERWPEAVAQIEGFFDCHLLNDKLPVALGEVGLDRFHLPKDDAVAAERLFRWQRAAFAAQLEIVRRLKCPLVVHSRGAFQESVAMIDASGVDWSKVVYHCFTEGGAEMAELLRRGGRGSFTGVLTYKNAEAVRAAAKAQGLACFMIETDAPYLTPVPHRGKPNEPAYLKNTADFAAELFGVGFEELVRRTTINAKGFYGLGA